MNTLTRLREAKEGFSATERRVADYVLQNAAELPRTSISAVAESCGTSKSMVVQLCKKAGFKGFKDLCNTLCVEQALETREPRTEYADMRVGCTAAQILRMTVDEEVRSIRDTADLVDVRELDRAANAILSARRIQLFGVGNSAVVALDMHNKLERIGLNAHFSQDTHCQLIACASLKKGDVALVFSYNGQTAEMLEAISYARACGATVITLTRYGRNQTADQADIRLYVAGNETLTRTAAMTSRLAMLSMVDVLYTCVASRTHEDIRPILERATQIAARRRK
jgi:DNA-binding MurR/RpiR family transcriptional regulator